MGGQLRTRGDLQLDQSVEAGYACVHHPLCPNHRDDGGGLVDSVEPCGLRGQRRIDWAIG